MDARSVPGVAGGPLWAYASHCLMPRVCCQAANCLWTVDGHDFEQRRGKLPPEDVWTWSRGPSLADDGPPSIESAVPEVKIGDREISGCLRAASVDRDSPNPQLRARLLIDDSAPFFDFTGQLTITTATPVGGEPKRLFTGYLLQAQESNAGSHLQELLAVSAPQMSDTSAPLVQWWGDCGFDVLLMLLQTGGVAQTSIQNRVERAQPTEDVFDVTAPIRNLVVESHLTFGSVDFLPPSLFEVPPLESRVNHLRREFDEATAVATVRVGPLLGWMYDGEAAGIRQLQGAISWALTLASYAGSSWPGGSALSYSRDSGRATVELGNAIYVRGRRSGRAWIREFLPVHTTASLSLGKFQGKDAPQNESMNNAVAACARIGDARLEPSSRVNALWECIEFLVSDVKAENLFSRRDRRRLGELMAEQFTEIQMTRIDMVLHLANQAPLLARLSQFVSDHRIDVSADELSLLRRLRKSRNESLHGKAASPPSASVLTTAASIAARFIISSRIR